MDKSRIFVSVVIPAYNQAIFLGRAIESVLAQTYPHYEIIVIDDGSTDETRQVAAGFGDRVRYIWQENLGLAGARNTGILAANNELIGLLDADDQWKPNYLEEMVNLTEENPAAVAYYCQAQCMDINGQDQPRILGGPPVPPEKLYWVVLGANFIIPSTVLLRKTPLIDAGMFDVNLRSCEDWDLWLRYSPDKQVVGIARTLIRYRIHGSSLSASVRNMQNAASSVIQKHFGSDDGKPETWSPEKRRAYGGLYRYHMMITVQRLNEWDKADEYLRQALQIDPSLATNIDLFYDLALGSQPIGYRGTDQNLNLEANASNLEQVLSKTFSRPFATNQDFIKRKTYATANYALGLVAYHARKRPECRSYLIKAIRYRPKLGFDSRLIGHLIRSFLKESHLIMLKNARRAIGF